MLLFASALIRNSAVKSLAKILWPTAYSRPAPPAVTSEDPALATDMEEAAEVLHISAQASAALSRRSLQHILIEKADARKKANLADQIDKVKDGLPTALGENVDEIRKVGNYAAHPIKSEQTGSIVPVETGEAEFTLEVLWEVADHYYTKPARQREIREELAKKRAEAKGGNVDPAE